MTTHEKPARHRFKPFTEMVQASEPEQPGRPSKTAQREGMHAAAQFKTFHWGVIAHGDCFMRNAEITIWDDGRCHFFADTSTTDAGDVWLVKGLDFKDANGTTLWTMPQFDGPVMTLANFDYILDREDLAIPPYIFPWVTGVDMHHHC